jgi:hypothetical protein
MKIGWIASLAVAATTSAFAQTTIYKHVDESGRTTYSNKPMKGATVMELEPITLIPAVSAHPASAMKAVATLERTDTPRTIPMVPSASPTLASIEPQVQRKRDDDRRRILEGELQREEASLTELRASLSQEQQNPVLVAAVRTAQQASDPSPAQMAEMRGNIEKASGRIRGLQATAAEHEKNIEALKKELGALKP